MPSKASNAKLLWLVANIRRPLVSNSTAVICKRMDPCSAHPNRPRVKAARVARTRYDERRIGAAAETRTSSSVLIRRQYSPFTSAVRSV